MSNKRIRIAFFVLCGILALTVWAFASVQRQCGALIRHTENILQILKSENGNPEDAIALLADTWQSDSFWLHLFVPDQPLNDLNRAIARLPALYDADCDELTSELCAIRADLQWICQQDMTVF